MKSLYQRNRVLSVKFQGNLDAFHMCSQCEPTHWFHDWLKIEHLHRGLGSEAVNEGSGDCERRTSGAALATVWCGLITPRLSPPGPSRGSNLSARLNVAPLFYLTSRSQWKETLSLGCHGLWPYALRFWQKMRSIDDLFCSLSPSVKMKKFPLMMIPHPPLPSRVNTVSHETADDTSESLKIRLVTLSHREDSRGNIFTCRLVLLALSLSAPGC